MIKTTYQTPEIRNENDEIVQEGAFGKNTALSNSTNDGWIDYVVNNLEALHDTIGDSAATLDGNGHVVEPANLAIGDEDGNRLKTSYLKLTGGTMSGTLNVAQNVKFQDNQENVFGGVYIPSSSATEQYAQFYGGEGTGVAGAKLTLYPAGDGRFKLDARSTDGANTYTLVTDNSGNLNWRGYALGWAKDYVRLDGSVKIPNTLTRIASNLDPASSTRTEATAVSLQDKNGSAISNFFSSTFNTYSFTGIRTIRSIDGTTNWADIRLVINSDGTYHAEFAKSSGLTFSIRANSGDIPSTSWTDNKYLPMAGGTMTGSLSFSAAEGRIQKANANYDSQMSIYGSNNYQNGSCLMVYGKNHASYGGYFRLTAKDDTNGAKELQGRPDGTLTWGGQDLNPQKETSYLSDTLSVPSGGTRTELISFSITKGTWLICYTADFSTNETGYRIARISSSATGGSLNRLAEVHAQAVSGTTTRLNGSVILRVGATATYYLNAQQDSGSALNVSGGVQTFRLSTVS